jgi:hypothetical protein
MPGWLLHCRRSGGTRRATEALAVQSGHGQGSGPERRACNGPQAGGAVPPERRLAARAATVELPGLAAEGGVGVAATSQSKRWTGPFSRDLDVSHRHRRVESESIMDPTQFDRLTQALETGLARRDVLYALLGTGTLGLLKSSDVEAHNALTACKKKSGKQKKACIKKAKKHNALHAVAPSLPPLPPCGGGCSGLVPQCCPPTTFAPGGYCATVDDVCCTPAQGGGACPPEYSQCCPPTTQDPDGLCTRPDRICCTSAEGGGTCPPDFPQCCPTSAQDPMGIRSGCCEKGQACCAETLDCPGGLMCDGYGCCVEDTTPPPPGPGQVQSESAWPTRKREDPPRSRIVP